MKKTIYDSEEREVLDFIEGETPDSISNLGAEKERYKEIFRDSATRRKSVNLRLFERDLHKIRTRALVQGIPYQTLISSIVHQYVNGQLISKD